MKNYDQSRQHIKKQRHYFPDKDPSIQSHGFFSSHVWMWELDYKESWAPKNWCFWTVVLEKTRESPLDCKEIKLINPKGNQPWIFTGRPDAEAPIFWPPDVNSELIGKDPDAGKDGRREEKGTTEDEIVGWHHWLSGHEFEQTLGDSEGQGSLAYSSPWDWKELEHNLVTKQVLPFKMSDVSLISFLYRWSAAFSLELIPCSWISPYHVMLIFSLFSLMLVHNKPI